MFLTLYFNLTACRVLNKTFTLSNYIQTTDSTSSVNQLKYFAQLVLFRSRQEERCSCKAINSRCDAHGKVNTAFQSNTLVGTADQPSPPQRSCRLPLYLVSIFSVTVRGFVYGGKSQQLKNSNRYFTQNLCLLYMNLRESWK